MTMRILVLAHNHPSLHPGGTETVAHELFREYREAGHEALFLAATNRLHREPHPGTSFQAIGDSSDEILMWAGHFDRLTMSQIDLYGFVPDMKNLLETFRPDVVHIHHLLLFGVELPTLVRRTLPNARIVMTLHDYYAICGNDGVMMKSPDEPCAAFGQGGLCGCLDEVSADRMRLRERYIRTHLEAVDHFTAPSAFLRDAYVRWGIPEQKIELLPNGRPTVEAAPARNAISEARNVFGYFGNLTPWKGIEVLLRACKKLIDSDVEFELRVHGGAPFQGERFIEEINALFDETSARVTRLGPYRPEDVPRLMQAVDWVVVPSVWWENAPLVIAEARQHKRPVIASGVGGMAEAVKDGVDGLHARRGDASDLARLMQNAAGDPDLHRRLVANNRPPPSAAAVAERYLRLFAKLKAAPQTVAA